MLWDRLWKKQHSTTLLNRLEAATEIACLLGWSWYYRTTRCPAGKHHKPADRFNFYTGITLGSNNPISQAVEQQLFSVGKGKNSAITAGQNIGRHRLYYYMQLVVACFGCSLTSKR